MLPLRDQLLVVPSFAVIVHQVNGGAELRTRGCEQGLWATLDINAASLVADVGSQREGMLNVLALPRHQAEQFQLLTPDTRATTH